MPLSEEFSSEEVSSIPPDEPADVHFKGEKGWSQSRCSEMKEKFKNIDDKTYQDFVEGFVQLERPLNEYTREEVCSQIAQQHTFKEICEHFDTLD